MNAAMGREGEAALGALVFLGWRFVGAAAVWLVLFPRCLRGWSGETVRRGLFLGLLLFVPLVLQVIGLQGTSEAVSAFFTSLTVVFVPILVTVISRRLPPRSTWALVGLAAVGVWLMTGAAPTGFGRGEAFSLACALLFSGHIIALTALGGRDPEQLTLAQFTVVGCLSLALAGAMGAGSVALDPARLAAALRSDPRGFHVGSAFAGSIPWLNFVLVVALCTVAAFGLSFRFQPRVSATRAAIIYLAEPVFAAIFAYVAVGRALAPVALLGAAIILVANVLSEWVASRESVG